MAKILKKSISKLKANPLRVEVVQNAGVAFIVKALSMLTMLLLEFCIARMLGVEQFGIYTFVLVWILTLTIVGTLGFNTSAIRFVSDYFSKQEISLLKGFLRYSLFITIIASSIVTGISLSFIKVLQTWSLISNSLASVFYVALPLIPLFSLLFVQGGILRGGRFLVLSLFFQNVFAYAVLLILILIGFYGGLFSISVNTIFILFYASVIAALIIQQIAIRKRFMVITNDVSEEFKASDWLRTSFSMMLSSSFQELMNRLDIIAIGIVIAPSATGLYAVALRFSRIVNVGLQITNDSSAHLFKPLYDQGKMKQFQALVFTTAKITMLTTIPIIVCLLIFPNFILSQYGSEFLSAKHLLRILLVGQVANVLFGPNALILNMTEYQNLLARIFTLVLVVDILLLSVLLPTLGVSGAALATTGAITFSNIAITFFVWRNLRINPTIVSSHAWRMASV